MKETATRITTGIELSIKKKKAIEHELIGVIVPHSGHTLWKINKETFEISVAEYSKTNYTFGSEENNPRVIIKEGYAYVSALNKQNALKKYKKGQTGSKPVEDKPLSFY